jgi:hypothetical protein
MSLVGGIVLLVVGIAIYLLGAMRVVPGSDAINKVLYIFGIVLAIIGIIVIVLAIIGYALLTGGILLYN